MTGLFFLVCLVAAIIQIISLKKFRSLRDPKYWAQFLGINLASLAILLPAYLILGQHALDLNDAFYIIFVCGFSAICNVVLLIAGIILKIITKPRSTKTKPPKTKSATKHRRSTSRVLLTGLAAAVLTALINFFTLLCLPAIITGLTTAAGEKMVVNYLEAKYGPGNYHMVSVENQYGDNGITSRDLTGYNYEMQSDFMDETFIVRVDDGLHYVKSDYFLPVYYSQLYNLDTSHNYQAFDDYVRGIIHTQYGQDASKINVRDLYTGYVVSWSSETGTKYDTGYFVVPADNGAIPTVEEVAESLVHHNGQS